VVEHLRDKVRFAVQEEQLGTGHAVRQALPLLEEVTGSVFICYGDMPFLSAASIRALIDAGSRPDAAGAILTMVLEDPPDYGRVIWDEYGHVWKVVEVKDCTPEELEIKEFNVGVYCFDTEALRWDLPRLTSDTAQGEYYLTDVVQVLADSGRRVETVRTDKFEDALGINDWEDLELAECTSGLIVGDRNYHSPKTK
jgi:bifunctional UDP-N-acetylglucosamine pyrophosphorylase / glucosamine-1-phosphate N-acetyltransferase